MRETYRETEREQKNGPAAEQYDDGKSSRTRVTREQVKN